VSFALIFSISFVIQRQLTETNKSIEKQRLFTAEELQLYTKDELYLAILGRRKTNSFSKNKKRNFYILVGHVFNVSSAPRFYSSTGSYKFYTGIFYLYF